MVKEVGYLSAFCVHRGKGALSPNPRLKQRASSREVGARGVPGEKQDLPRTPAAPCWGRCVSPASKWFTHKIQIELRVVLLTGAGGRV